MGGELEDGGDGGVTYELILPMEIHNMGIGDAKMGRVVGGDDLDDDYVVYTFSVFILGCQL